MEPTTPVDVARACKLRADQLVAMALANGAPMKRGHALDRAARERGYRDWNAARAADKAAAASKAGTPSAGPLWRDIARPLPRLPLRIHPSGSKFYYSISELMRWAQALEAIAKVDGDSARQELLEVVGGDLPYVLVRNYAEWGDDVFRLCNRGYDPWPGIALNRDELSAAGVLEWHEKYGGHDGEDMFTVLTTESRYSRDVEALQRAARLLANIALVADKAFSRQDGEELPPGRGFTIDLAASEPVTAKRVARLIGSRDDTRHRQLRVSTSGIAYLSDEVATSNIGGLAFRLETWAQGSGYVGPAAAEDENWVNQVLRDLQDNWPRPKSTLVDF